MRYSLMSWWVATIVVLVAGRTTFGDDDRVYRQLVIETLSTLETKYANARDDEETVFECKRLVKNVISKAELATSDEERRLKYQILSDEIAKSLSRAPVFRFGDYYLLWLGGRVLVSCPPADKKYYVALVNKIENRDRSKLSCGGTDEVCVMTLEILSAGTRWRGGALFDKNQQLNAENWDAFRAHVEEFCKR